MAKTKFIVSNETINSNGFMVQTAGIDTAKFERNPVMLYMHDRSQGVIGRWENIRKEGKNLTAEAVFDESSELGAKVKQQVENGFLRCASIGIDKIESKVINGVETVIKCDLYEISIVDIPANEDAVKLYKDGRTVARLSQLKDNSGNEEQPGNKLRVRLIDVLGLDETATDDDIVNAVRELQNDPTNADKEVNAAIECGLLAETDRESFQAMAHGNIKAFRSYCNDRKRKQADEIKTLLNSNIRKVIPQERPVFEAIGARMGVVALRKVLETMHGPVKLGEILKLSGDTDKSGWTLEDYRKYAPEELRDNPELYNRLIGKESGGCSLGRDLEYYRRHDPAYLETHPEEYRQMIENEIKRAKRQWH